MPRKMWENVPSLWSCMALPVVQGVKSSFLTDFTLIKMITLHTSSGSCTFARIVALLVLQIPQKNLLGETVTDENPLPGFGDDGGTMETRVAVSSPIKMGMGTNVAVGRLGSWVGKRTIVAVALGRGVFVGLVVGVNVGVTVAVAEGANVLVGGNSTSPNGMPAHACTRIASKTT